MNCTSGRATSGPAFQERHPAGRQSGRDAFAVQIGADERRHDAVEPHRAVERARFFTRIGDARRNVVLQILADARQRRLDGDAVGGELGRIADARQHQKLRRVDDAAAEDDFSLRIRGDGCTPLDIFDAGGAAAVEHDLRRQRVDLDREVLAAATPAADRRRRRCNGARPSPSSARCRSLPAGRRCNRASPCIRRRGRQRRRRRPAGRQRPPSASSAGRRRRDKSSAPPFQDSWRRK